jgi:hypothetical protein
LAENQGREKLRGFASPIPARKLAHSGLVRRPGLHRRARCEDSSLP